MNFGLDLDLEVVKSKMDSGLRFFKRISSSQKMVIPAAVIRQMPRVNRVVLRDRYGNIWVVSLDIDFDEWSFKEGWPHFYDQNSLNPFDFLFFEYKGGSTCVFDFKILGQNGCQKMGLSKFRIKEEPEVEDLFNDDDDDNGDDHDYAGHDDDSDDGGGGDHDDDGGDHDGDEYAEEEEEPLAIRPTNDRPFFISRSRSRRTELFIPKNVIVYYGLKLPERLFLVDDGGNKWETKVKRWENGRVCCTGRGWRRLCDANNINKNDTCICEFILQGCQDPCILVRVVVDNVPGTSRNATKDPNYGDDIFRQGLTARPNNRPFFVSRSRPQRNELMIPNEVINDYKLIFPEALFLVDERGNRWETKVKKWKDGRVWCSGGGWRSLCNVNNIHRNDACICDFFLQLDDPRILVRHLKVDH